MSKDETLLLQYNPNNTQTIGFEKIINSTSPRG